MQLKGMLIGCRSYSFTDQQTGNDISGGKLFLAVSTDEQNSAGMAVSEIPYDYGSHNKLASICNQHSQHNVIVDCDLSIVGRKTKIKAIDIQLDPESVKKAS